MLMNLSKSQTEQREEGAPVQESKDAPLKKKRPSGMPLGHSRNR
jgi:hypothetical protein